MVSYVEVKGFEAFDKYLNELDPKGIPVLLYFSGEKLSEGQSWCPDCNNAISKMVGKKKKIDIHHINNFEEFTEYVNGLPEKRHPVYFLFTGKKKENGRSWCIYCQIAEPVVKAYLTELNKSVIFVYVDVGDRDYWKDRACPFRTDKRTKLMVIPTIIKWQGVQRLEGEQCSKRELLQMIFEDEE